MRAGRKELTLSSNRLPSSSTATPIEKLYICEQGAFALANHATSMASECTYQLSQLIPPALWATRGLGVVSIKLPLYLPSPRAFDPAELQVVQAYIVFSKP